LYLVYYHRGVSYHKIGRLDLAIADFTKAIEINSDVADAYANRGKVRLDKRENKLAVVDFNKALEIKPALADELKPWLARARGR
jgi:tetratricopeptide (TPR) repeat protein